MRDFDAIAKSQYSLFQMPLVRINTRQSSSVGLNRVVCVLKEHIPSCVGMSCVCEVVSSRAAFQENFLDPRQSNNHVNSFIFLQLLSISAWRVIDTINVGKHIDQFVATIKTSKVRITFSAMMTLFDSQTSPIGQCVSVFGLRRINTRSDCVQTI